MTPADICYAALMEIRPDLADLVRFFVDDDGTWYLEPTDEVSDADWEIMQRAERLALGVAR